MAGSTWHKHTSPQPLHCEKCDSHIWMDHAYAEREDGATWCAGCEQDDAHATLIADNGVCRLLLWPASLHSPEEYYVYDLNRRGVASRHRSRNKAQRVYDRWTRYHENQSPSQKDEPHDI